MADDPKPGAATDDLELGDDAELDDELGDGEEGGEGAAEVEAEDTEGDGQGERHPAPAKTESKAARTIRELRARAQRAERERDDYLRRQAAPRAPDPAEQARQQEERRQRLALMGPDERTDFLLNEQQQNFSRQIGGMQYQTADAIDQAKYDRLCDRNPVAEQLRDEVETTLQQWRGNGSNPPREAVLKYLLGERALKRAPAARKRQERSAEARRDRQTVRPGGGRGGDVAAPGRGAGGGALQKRIDEYDRDGLI